MPDPIVPPDIEITIDFDPTHDIERAENTEALIAAIKKFAHVRTRESIETVYNKAKELEFRSPLRDIGGGEWAQIVGIIEEGPVVRSIGRLEDDNPNVFEESFAVLIETYQEYKETVRNAQLEVLIDHLYNRGPMEDSRLTGFDPNADAERKISNANSASTPSYPSEEISNRNAPKEQVYMQLCRLYMYMRPPGLAKDVVPKALELFTSDSIEITASLLDKKLEVPNMLHHFERSLTPVDSAQRRGEALIELIKQAYEDTWAMHTLHDLILDAQILSEAPKDLIHKYFVEQAIPLERAISTGAFVGMAAVLRFRRNIENACKDDFELDQIHSTVINYYHELNDMLGNSQLQIMAEASAVGEVIKEPGYGPLFIKYVMRRFEKRIAGEDVLD